MARTLFRIILIVLLCFTFYKIFQFSNENAETFGSRSMGIMKKIINNFPYTKNLGEAMKDKIIKRAEPLLRKLAHFSIYMVVGILIMTFVSTYKLLLWKKLLISIMVGLVYAISDEYHQTFIQGRSGELRDVLIDTTGVICGIAIVIIIIAVYKALGEKYKTMRSVEK